MAIALLGWRLARLRKCQRSRMPWLARGTSVGVLRFANLSGDPGQDYFADGIVEDIITGLSRISSLSVCGRQFELVVRSRR